VKLALKHRRIRLLIATDAAGEGLNLQFCGALVNFDLPWNPMKVEQRIGRIDRIGQAHSEIAIVNLAYKDTVEADVYMALGTRINLFEGVVGKLQPILSRLPRQIEEAALARPEVREAVRARFLSDLESEVKDAEGAAFDIDEVSVEDLKLPDFPPPSITPADIEVLLRNPRTLAEFARAVRGTSHEPPGPVR
jgi:superfamily II DNA/RNA helicase